MRLLDYDNRRVHEFATRDGDAGQRHHIDAHARVVEWNKRKQHGDRNRDYRNGGARKMPKKNHDDGYDREDDRDQREARIRDRTLNQFGPIVYGNYFYALRQTWFDLFQSNLYAANYIESVAALAHDNDSRDDFPCTIQIGGPSPDIRADDDFAHVLDPDGS